jgi:outer membrane receptor for ferrienterochelin and colicin
MFPACRGKCLLLFFGFLLAMPVAVAQQPKPLTISGKIVDAGSGESLGGATVYVSEIEGGTVSNTYGFYSLSLIRGDYHLRFSFVGYEALDFVVHLHADTSLFVSMHRVSNDLSEVEVKGISKTQNITRARMSVHELQMSRIEKIPSFMGEVDLIKALALLPGVKSVAEGSSGVSVRGGSADQNLVLLDGATVYNSGHLMGFFSVFNSDAVKSVKLYKGDLPPAYGGRLSSLIDVRMKEGNRQQFHVQGGLGLIASRLMLEGPLKKEKASFMISGRRTYADLFLKLSNNEKLKSNQLYFYDLNTKFNFDINKNNHLYLSAYFGNDVFKNDFFTTNWGNATTSLRWNHLFSHKLFANFTWAFNRFNYNLGLAESNPRSFIWQSALTDMRWRAYFDWYFNPSNRLNFGVSVVHHDFFPGKITGTGQQAVIDEYRLPNKDALEMAVYAGNEQKLSKALRLTYGLRLSVFSNLGPETLYRYDENYQVTDSVVYGQRGIYHSYVALEPRLGAVFELDSMSSLKVSYARNVQYIQKAQNSTGGNPLDIWFPANPNIKPQRADQLAGGYYRNFHQNEFETSIEIYYKWINNAIDFKDHADLLLNKFLDGELRIGKAYSYGVELLVKKKQGLVSGWLSYTYSRSMRQIQEINQGKPYPAPYDKPHDLNLVVNFDLLPRISIGLAWVYMTGQAVTFPEARFEYGGTIIPVYSSRNAYRLPDYHRLDISFNWKLKPKKERKYRQSLNFSIYNVYNRKNTWVVNFENDPDVPNATYAEKTYLFGILPTLTYNFNF